MINNISNFADLIQLLINLGKNILTTLVTLLDSLVKFISSIVSYISLLPSWLIPLFLSAIFINLLAFILNRKGG